MISGDGRLKIVDFGLAHRGDGLMTEATTLHRWMTAGVPAGTPYAMAPEQVRGETTDARRYLELLACCCTRWRLARSRSMPQTVPELFAAILKEPPRGRQYSSPRIGASASHRTLPRKGSVPPISTGARRQPRPRRRFNPARRRWDDAWPHYWRKRPRLIAIARCVLVATLARRSSLFNVGDCGIAWRGRDAGSPTLAVLPFENLSGDPTQEFFSDGLTDEMITRLGRLQPRGSASSGAALRCPTRIMLHLSTRWRASWASIMFPEGQCAAGMGSRIRINGGR